MKQTHEEREARKRKQGVGKEGKAVKQKQGDEEEGFAAMQRQGEEEAEGNVVKQEGFALMQMHGQEEAEGNVAKQKQGEEDDGTTMPQNEEEGEGKGEENKDKEAWEEIETVRLKSADNCIVEVEWGVAKQFGTVNLFEVDPAQYRAESYPPFFLENVNADVLAIVVDFCRFHVSPDTILGPPERPPDRSVCPHEPTPPSNPKYIRQQRIRDWENSFLRRFDHNTIFNLIQAASYLNIQVLLDASCDFIVQKMMNSSLEETRIMFNVVNDFTPEQQAAVRKTMAWVLTD